MKRYGYLRDPACLLASAAYAINRWCIPVALKGAFLRGHFNDLLFIPAALPPMLWLQRRLKLRGSDERPAWGEVILHFVTWSIAAEIVGPRLFAHATGDVWDVVAYAVGAAGAGAYWNWA